MTQAVATVRAAGFEVVGCLDDNEAVALIQGGRLDVVAIGGGVEPKSRERIKSECRGQIPGVQVLDVLGPERLLPLLRSLARAEPSATPKS